MNIFLRRIPANTRHIEISEFVAPALNNGFFRKSGRIVDVEILALQDTRVGTIEYHGLVTLDSDITVQRVVKALKNRRFNGRMVVVRPYYHRSWYNDPRQNQTEVPADIADRRKGDRRRGRYLQVIKNASDRFNSEDDFFKSVNHQQFSISFIVPPDLEAAMMECLAGFELDQDSYGEHRMTKFLTAADANEQQTARFQIYAEKMAISALLERLKQEFSGSGIHYWIMPVIEKGEI
ncbi:hypothetical protein A1507_15075 [Methylomonas koyamae]|uniref:RRM domain-containing protein n=1 Tax=Methylomonas koyamae TaxID=702114 RepID=A0A177P9G2_9GAMM|nr:DUF3240 family protein [Methylomonas koyamae]ANE57408.1 hypothetical protein AYM39_20990 [Methylomonas sp. DH-1]ATG92391.1 hypothetical protein MKLM6_4224 [Methylomonas koyamae]OAI14612.1 hypothetical protein A1507_15075 [Methylomonas koyamae]OAI26093.1 hypothetical protein A1356_12220 [Methylomonas koyamae]WNB75857.1 DUF3240 family protein [Methylomonas koyamae]